MGQNTIAYFLSPVICRWQMAAAYCGLFAVVLGLVHIRRTGLNFRCALGFIAGRRRRRFWHATLTIA